MDDHQMASQLAEVLAPLLCDAVQLQEPPDAQWRQVLPLNDELIVIPVLHEVRRLARRVLPLEAQNQAIGNRGRPSLSQMRTWQQQLRSELAEPTCSSRPFLWSLLTADRHAFKAMLRRGQTVLSGKGVSPQGGHARPLPEATGSAAEVPTQDEDERPRRRVRRRIEAAVKRLLSEKDERRVRPPRPAAAWLSRWFVGLLLNGIVVAVMGVALLYRFGVDPGKWTTLDEWLHFGLLKVFAVWAMSFLPGWLFVRFLGQRARALWWDFVLSLHRLGVDDRQHLPEPPVNSHYHRLWVEAGGSPLKKNDSIYQDKFDAYYGKKVSRIGSEDQTTRIWSETLFPVGLLTAVLAGAWTAVLWDTSFVSSPSSALDMLKFGFLGAYAFIIQMLIRRFFQSDLRASAYASAVVRIFVVAILVAVVHQIAPVQSNPRAEAVVAFVIGFFPIVGMQALQRMAATVLRAAVPSLNSPYPLDQIDGLNVWYEARLLEEGIEDMQNLTTTNLVDVILHTHVPVGRLVDWIDQAHLYQHLDRTELNRKERRRAAEASEMEPASRVTPERGSGQESDSAGASSGSALEDSEAVRYGTRARHTLRRLGVRTATDLLTVMPLPLTAADRVWLDGTGGLDSYTVEKLVSTLRAEPGLDVVWRWRQGAIVNAMDRPCWPKSEARAPGRGGGVSTHQRHRAQRSAKSRQAR